MKKTGIIRKIDELGRIVIPMEVRRYFDIDVKEPLEIYLDDGKIILSKLSTSCIFCGIETDLKAYKDKSVCEDCAENISGLSK